MALNDKQTSMTLVHIVVEEIFLLTTHHTIAFVQETNSIDSIPNKRVMWRRTGFQLSLSLIDRVERPTAKPSVRQQAIVLIGVELGVLVVVFSVFFEWACLFFVAFNI